MSLNNINLPASVVAELYHESLVDTGEIKHKAPVTTTETVTEKITAPEPVIDHPLPKPKAKSTKPDSTPIWKWLGENNKNILIVVSYTDVVHLPDEQLQFLTTILSACKLSLADVALVNLPNQPHQDYKEILAQFKSRVALLFDIEPASFGLPMSFPHYQIQPYANCSFLYSPSLKEVEEDVTQKKQLWEKLKRLFNL
ncbi:MAG TPA: hypothetical protein VHM26_19180 [Chitinophagaceae bacterium]|jgi:hypothetical protein|nr:hypothetical protein [Chitinophagaceae bacterium]